MRPNVKRKAFTNIPEDKNMLNFLFLLKRAKKEAARDMCFLLCEGLILGIFFKLFHDLSSDRCHHN